MGLVRFLVEGEEKRKKSNSDSWVWEWCISAGKNAPPSVELRRGGWRSSPECHWRDCRVPGEVAQPQSRWRGVSGQRSRERAACTWALPGQRPGGGNLRRGQSGSGHRGAFSPRSRRAMGPHTRAASQSPRSSQEPLTSLLGLEWTRSLIIHSPGRITQGRGGRGWQFKGHLQNQSSCELTP